MNHFSPQSLPSRDAERRILVNKMLNESISWNDHITWYEIFHEAIQKWLSGKDLHCFLCGQTQKLQRSHIKNWILSHLGTGTLALYGNTKTENHQDITDTVEDITREQHYSFSYPSFHDDWYDVFFTCQWERPVFPSNITVQTQDIVHHLLPSVSA